MNFSSHMIKFALLLSVSSAASAATSSDLTFDMKLYLEKHAMTAADLGNIETVVAPGDGKGWVSGAVGTFLPAYLSLRVSTQPGSAVERSLKISYNPIFVEPVRLAACSADGMCADLKGEPSGRGVNVAVDGLAVYVEVIGAPCVKVASCDILIPSWSLEKRRQSHEATWKSFPRIATIVDHKTGISILDATTGTEWLSYDIHTPGNEGDSLGDLVKASMAESGMLTLQYAKGMVVLDFVADRLWISTESGLLLSRDGLGQKVPVNWTRVARGELGGLPIMISDEWYVTQTQVARWYPRTDNLKEIVGVVKDGPQPFHLAGANSAGIDCVSLIGKEATLWRFFLATRSFSSVMTLEDVADIKDVRINGGIIESNLKTEVASDGMTATTSMSGTKVNINVRSH